MYRGFNLIGYPFVEEWYEKGKIEYERRKKEVSKILDNFITPDGSIDGSKLQENWFPQIECDIFISHSHKDQKRAITLSGMFNEWGLSCFVDSCIWGHADELLKLIDNEHCYNPEKNTYYYELRNFTTSHVHMMLSNALFRMIDNSECLFFLNSPNSIQINDVISKTISPWIYAELSITQVIRKKKPDRQLIKSETKRRDINARINIQYDINLSHLIKLEKEDLGKWLKTIENNKNEHVLDSLYKTFSLPRTTLFPHE